MGKHSSGPANDGPEGTDDLPVFHEVTDENADDGDEHVAVSIRCLPYGHAGMLGVGIAPFFYTQVSKDEADVAHVSVLYGGGLEVMMDDETAVTETRVLNTVELARYYREVAEIIEQSGEFVKAKSAAEKDADDAAWADLLTRAAEDRLVKSDSEVGDPATLSRAEQEVASWLSGPAPSTVDYKAGAAFATDRIGKSAAQQDADDLRLLGADSPVEPAIEEIVDAQLMEDDE